MHSRDRLVSACMVKSRSVTRGQFVVQTDGPSGQLAVDQFLEHLVRPLSTRAPAPSPAPASLRAGSHVTVDVRLLLLIQYIALVAYEICVSYVLSIKYQNKHIRLVESPLYIDRRVTHYLKWRWPYCMQNVQKSTTLHKFCVSNKETFVQCSLIRLWKPLRALLIF